MMIDKNCEGLEYLTWDRFDDPSRPGTGYKFMDRETAYILDRVVARTKMNLDIELAYATEQTARALSLPYLSSHKIGKAVRIRILTPKKRMRLIRALILEGVTRIQIGHDSKFPFVYFDTDFDKEEEWLSVTRTKQFC